MTDVVCIGRNIKNTPMEEVTWKSFIDELYSQFVDVYFYGEGKGVYKEGLEDSYCIVGVLNTETNLADLAKKYKQESIALVKSKTKFIEASK
jgi:TPP-dependent 2-oxoacid decarboxylase